jgi:fumarylacetoacetate (FAA) hydrolase
MRLCAFQLEEEGPERLGVGLADDPERIVEIVPDDSRGLSEILPRTLADALADWDRCRPLLEAMSAVSGPNHAVDELRFLPPVARPGSFRDFYAFEQHVKTARAGRGLKMIPEWYELPVFYFSNPAVMVGDGAIVGAPPGCAELDFELEIGAVIGTMGRDLDAETAETCIAGYCVLNDWSARDLQRQEMKVGLGPAKGKDFATGLGPWLVTPDELADKKSGLGYDLVMIARRNGEEISRGNWRDIHYGFGQMLARASAGVMLHPGDVIGSGTVGTGCILELGADKAGGWLQPGDVLELEIERLGILRNTIDAASAEG